MSAGCADKDGERVLDPVPAERSADDAEGAAIADSAADPEAGQSLGERPYIDDREPALPDLVIVAFEILPEEPEYDDSVRVRVSVLNQGRTDARTSDVQFLCDGLEACRYGTRLIPRGSSNWTAWCRLGILGGGTHAIEARADIDDYLDELDEENNYATTTLVIPLPPDLPDLRVQQLEFSPAVPGAGDDVDVRVRLENIGYADAEGTQVGIQLNGSEQCRLDLLGLPVGAAQWSDWCGLGALGAGLHEIVACVDVDGIMEEINEENNCRTDDLYVHWGETGPTVWYVLAAWQEEKTWAGFEFGLGGFDANIYEFVADGICQPENGSALAYYHDAQLWPSPNNGISVVLYSGLWHGNFQPLYWFAGYAYGEGVIPIDVMPTTGMVAMLPPLGGVVSTTSPDRLGGMGVLTAGHEAYPTDEGNEGAEDLRGFALITHHPPGLIYTTSENDWCERYANNPLGDASEQNCTISIPARARVWSKSPHAGR
ncbi:MAG: hypothetical protein KAY32_09205 [Candidatus Eisenbacteria sp.]|nr:hypothetical protein [Candidatus Eisenbacteria bacterium]